ncbi:Tachykinin-like peptides receptor 86C [Trichoplax sp. H2]|nr:Tachykinin-like peptides receptor 86C [Trichoplax sp. H2]|eukprot:RDD42800.1 Tachykinin-like peptides receptor 86C [Trichoplax sp. H2]
MITTPLTLSNESFSSALPTKPQVTVNSIPLSFLIHAIILFIVSGSGVIANSAVFTVILRSSKLRSMNTFMLFCNLAVADFLLAASASVTAIILLNRGLFFSLFMCKALSVLQTTTITVSALTLVIISIDRSLAIAKPFFFEHWCVAKVILAAISVIWILAFAYAAPLLYYAILTPNGNCFMLMGPHSATTYQIVGTIIQFLLPLFAGIISYNVINRVLGKLNALPGYLQPDLNRLSKAKHRAKTAFIVIIVYVITGVGFYTLSIAELGLRSYYNKDPALTAIIFNLSLAFRTIAYSSSLWNPFIYAASSKSFRQSMNFIRSPASVGTAPKSSSSVSRESQCAFKLMRRDYLASQMLGPPNGSITTTSSDRPDEVADNNINIFKPQDSIFTSFVRK